MAIHLQNYWRKYQLFPKDLIHGLDEINYHFLRKITPLPENKARTSRHLHYIHRDTMGT